MPSTPTPISRFHNHHIWRGCFQLDQLFHPVIAYANHPAIVPTANLGSVIRPAGKPQKNALAGLWNVQFKGIGAASLQALEAFAKHNTQSVYQIPSTDDDNLFIFGHYNGTNYLCVGVYLAVETCTNKLYPIMAPSNGLVNSSSQLPILISSCRVR